MAACISARLMYNIFGNCTVMLSMILYVYVLLPTLALHVARYMVMCFLSVCVFPNMICVFVHQLEWYLWILFNGNKDWRIFKWADETGGSHHSVLPTIQQYLLFQLDLGAQQNLEALVVRWVPEGLCLLVPTKYEKERHFNSNVKLKETFTPKWF